MRSRTLPLLLGALLLLAVPPMTTGQTPSAPSPDLVIEDLDVVGEPRWIHGMAAGDPTVTFTVRNQGSAPAPAYTIQYSWIKDGEEQWLRGDQTSSTDVRRDGLAAQEARAHSQGWDLGQNQSGQGAIRVAVTVGTQASGDPDAEATVPLFIPTHEVEFSVPGDDQTIRPLETRFVRANVTNLGNVPETVQIQPTMYAQPMGRLGDLEDYLQHETLVVPPGATRASTLFVDYHFSGDSSAFTANHTLRAVTAYGRTLVADTPVLSSGTGALPDASPFDLERVGSDTLTVPEDAAATFDYRITNKGHRSDTYRITAVSETGWQAEPVLAGATPPPEGGVRAALDPDQSLRFSLQVQPPADALPGTPSDVVLRVVSDRRPVDAVDEAWQFRVQGPGLRIEPAGDWDAPLYVDDEALVSVRLHNDGDAPVPAGTLRLRVLPNPGADPLLLATADAPSVQPGKSAVVALDAGTYARPGPAHFLIDWTGAGVHAQNLERERFVRNAGVGLTLPTPLAGAPGELVGYRAGDHVLTVRNTGNAEETFRAHVAAGDAALVSDPVFTLAPGQERSLSLDHRIPLPAGRLAHVGATIVVALEDRPDLNWTTRISTQVLDVNAPRLQAVDVPHLWAAGEPLLLRVSTSDDSAVGSVRVHHTDSTGNETVQEMSAGADGNWTRSLDLAAGNHSLSFSARDVHGNEANLTATAVEVRPVPPPTVQVLGAGNGGKVRSDVLLDVRVEDALPLRSVTVQARDAEQRLLWQRDLDPSDPRFDLAGTPAGVVTLTVEATNTAGARSDQSLTLTVLEATDPSADIDVSGNAAPAPALWSMLAAILASAGLRRRPPSRRGARPASRRRRASRHASALLVVALMLGLPLVPADSTDPATVDPVALEWWDNTEVGKGFHIRVPVTVQNHRDHPVTNGAVLAEVDVAAKLVEAGWVSQARSGIDLLRSFELDDASVRVVAMANLEPMNPGTTNGLLGLHTSEYPRGDLRRHEVPSTHFTGSLSGREGTTFDARTNPYLTVLWRVEETLQPDEERHYMVYLDSKTNREHPHAAPDYRGVPGGALLERTFWSGPGVDLVGVVAPPSGRPGVATVIGLHDDTTVEVLVGNSGGTFSPQEEQSTHTNPFTINRHEFRQIQISNQVNPFRLLADKPILALVDSEGYVPTTTGHTVGSEFLFSTTYTPQDVPNQNPLSLFFFNHDPSKEALVRFEQWIPGNGWVDRGDVHLSHDVNLRPYTLGLGASAMTSGSTCTYPGTTEMAIVPASGNFRATVYQGGPVSLQLQPVRGLTQLPAFDGTPTGTTFWSALNLASCGSLRQYNVYATAPTSTGLGLSSLESPLELVSPRCTKAPCEGHPVGPLPDEAMTQRTFSGTDDLPERPIRFDFDDPAWLMVAPPQGTTSLANTPLRGPLGGADAGRSFVGYGALNGPPLLYAPFADTTIQTRVHYAAAGTQESPRPLVQSQLASLPTLTGDSILSYQLDADRPTIVLPRGASTGFLGGIPATLNATVHGADYRGHLVELKSGTGLDPVSGSTVPGEPITYSLEVTNRGRGPGASDLPDTIDLSHSELPEGWDARLSRTSIPLRSGETQSMQFTITPSMDAQPGQLGSITVKATSRSNPQVVHSIDTVTHIKRAFDVGIWFDQAVVGPKVDRGFGPAGEPVEYDVVVQNLGTVTDTIALDVSRPDGEWDALLLRGGQAVAQLTLDSQESATLTLRITPPAGLSEGFLQTTVTAQSTSSPAVLDRVFALTRIQTPSDLSLEVEDRTRWPQPGGEAVFNVTVSNEGGTSEVFFDLRADLLPGWTEPTVFLPLNGERHPIDRISIGPGELLRLGIALNASSDAVTGDLASIRFQVSSAGQEGGLEAFLHAIVRPVHHIEVETPSLPLHVPRSGVSVPVELRLTNDGSMEEHLTPAAAALPAGWDLEFPAQEVLLPRNATQVLRLELDVPNGTAEGEYIVAVALTSPDGAHTEVELPVRVGTFAGHALDGTTLLTAQPGRIAWTEHVVRNEGNVLLEVHVEASESEGWSLARVDPPFPLPPGAEAAVRIGWQVPAGATDGLSRHRADVVLRPASPTVEPVRDAVEVDIDVGRPALRVVSTSGFAGAAGQIVHARLANDGSRTAFDVAVELRVASETVDRVVLAEVPPGGIRNVTLLQPEGRPGTATVVLDPDRAVVESDHSDNVHVVPDLGTKATPGPTGAVLALLLVLLAGARVRMSRITRGGQGVERTNGHAMAGNDLNMQGSGTPECVGGCLPEDVCRGSR